MGSTQSTATLTEEDTEDILTQTQTHGILTQRDVRKMYHRYCRLKGSKPVMVTDDLAGVPAVSMNPLLDVIVSLFDPQGTGTVTFLSFVHVLSVFHPNAPLESKLRLAFSVYDTDGDGIVTRDKLTRTIRLMVGSNLSDMQLTSILDNTCHDLFGAELGADVSVTFDDFVAAVRSRETDIHAKVTIAFDR